MLKKSRLIGGSSLLAISLFSGAVMAAPISIVNAGFEDVSGQSAFNEFTFGQPAGWTVYDPNNIVPNAGVFTGTLQPNGVDFFTQVAPEGDRVAILFNSTNQGAGEYGYSQTLNATLQSFTRYDLSVEIGDIDSGVAANGTFFNLEEFPGYRIELLAGGQVIAQDNNTFANTFTEGLFSNVNLSFTTGSPETLAQFGQALGIRLISLNEVPAGFNVGNSPDLEVDFDNVELTATLVPVPAAVWLFGSGLIGLIGIARRKKT